MYSSSTQAAGHIARRERLGVFQAKPVVTAPVPPKTEREQRREEAKQRFERDWLFLTPSEIENKSLFGKKSWKEILNEVAKLHNIPVTDIVSERRQRDIVAARHEYIWRLRYETPMSLEAIGRRCGDRDHATVRNAIMAHEKRCNPLSRSRIEEVRKSNMFERGVSEREMIEEMILEGASTYRIRVECGVGRVKVNQIRAEMEAKVNTANIIGERNG